MQNEKYTAIIIDDESWTRDVLRYLGEWDQLGIEIVAEASDGEYGLELILNLDPDIIVTDVKMPNMDGLTLLSILRKKNCRSKILFVSGHDDYQYIRNAIQLKANDYLLKPVKQEELNKQLKRCIIELEQEQKFDTHKPEKDRHKEVNPQLILHVEWINEYMDIRSRIQEVLKRNHLELLKQHMNRLEQLILQKEGDDLSKDIAIYIYFDFHHLLHRFISDNGCQFQDFFDGKSGAYVFGTDFSVSEMFRILILLFQKAIEKVEQLHKEKNRIDIKAVCNYLEANYTETITLEQTAEKFYVSKEYLSKVFKEETGTGFASHITALRMKKARELLLTEGVPIKEIAWMTGYKEMGHFYKVFKKHFGITPGEMIQNIKNIQ